ncbi:cytochrome P450 [Salinispora mooreana]|uniref:cytochrome P450 n=1 Tax=Salinispora mooreana TaxID=999545 RepID=UPI00036B1550|nr:cytochrome P450 [Salinispora mooreana]
MAAVPRLTFADGGKRVLPWFRRMRDDQPVWYDQGTKSWNVFRYADIAQILKDPVTFSSDPGRSMPPELAEEAEGSLVAVDPPRHTRLRGLISAAFTPRLVEQLAPRVRSIGELLLNRAFVDRRVEGEFDIIGDLAYLLPVYVIGELLGLPESDRGYLVRAADEFYAISADDPFDGAYMASMQSTLDELGSYMLDHAERRRAKPGDDLISALAHAEIDGERLNDREIRNFAILLLTAGHITTTALLGNTLLALGERQDIMLRWRQGQVDTAILLEEVLRHRTPFTEVYRFTTTEVTIGNQVVPGDQLLRLWIASGNRDERQFADPDTFVLGRDSKHLGFGLGIHYCLGASLARMESSVVLGLLAERTTSLAPAVEALSYYDAPGIFCLRSLPVSYRRT